MESHTLTQPYGGLTQLTGNESPCQLSHRKMNKKKSEYVGEIENKIKNTQNPILASKGLIFGLYKIDTLKKTE
jgi:hypothetical protein